MAILNALQAGASTGGSIQSAHGYNQSQNQSFSNTAGNAATAENMASAQRANQQQIDMMREAMEFNAREAQKQRDWQEKMANTVYTRSVANMKEAGINPILAANMGLSGANVGSGATANISAPAAHMGTAIAEQNSASTGSAYGENWSSGSSWNESTSGLAEGLRQMGELVKEAFAGLNSAINLNVNMQDMSKLVNDTLPDTEANNELAEKAKESGNKIAEYSANAIQGMIPKFMQPWLAKMWDKANGNVPNPYSKKFRGGGAGHKF